VAAVPTVIIGDSQALGLAPHLARELPRYGYGVTSVLAEVGTSTRAVLRRGWIREALTSSPRALIVVLGGNDDPHDVDVYADLLRSFVAQIPPGIQVIWIGPMYAASREVEERHAAVREWQRQILPQLGVTWVDPRPWSQAGHAPDGVHFTREAYAAIAQAIARHVFAPPVRWILAPVAPALVLVAWKFARRVKTPVW
jgi:lysophospholipase L1-like esterase